MIMTKDELYEILNKPDSECNGAEIHLKHCYTHNNYKSIFRITGIDLSSWTPPLRRI